MIRWQSLAPALFFFFAGAGSLYLADLIISSRLDASTIEQWTATKVSMLLVGQAALFGFDQLIVREPHARVPLARVAAAAAIAAGSIAGLFAFLVGRTDIMWALPIVVPCYVLSILSFARARSAHQFAAAHLVRDGWKVAFAIAIIAYLVWPNLPAPPYLLATTMALAVLPLIGLLRLRPHDAIQRHSDISDLTSAVRSATPFFMSSFALAAGAYAELALMTSIAPAAQTAQYLQLAVAFSYPALMLNTFISGVLSAHFRDNLGTFLLLTGRWHWRLAGLVFATALVFFSTGYLLHSLIMPPTTGNATFVAMIMSITGSVRLAHAITASGLGVLAPIRQLNQLAMMSFLGGLLFVSGVLILVAIGLDPAASCALGTLLYWSFLLTISIRASRVVARELNSTAPVRTT
ncbi:MAG: hypothetical protein R3C30_09070 [Hyphomonadaceae bacterium]